jgi:hypothetical protein
MARIVLGLGTSHTPLPERGFLPFYSAACFVFAA